MKTSETRFDLAGSVKAAKEAGIEVKNRQVFLKDKLVKFEAIYGGSRNIVDPRVVKYLFDEKEYYAPTRNILQIALNIELQSFNGKFYKGSKVLTESQALLEIQGYNEELDYNTLLNVSRAIKEFKKLDKIPKYELPRTVPIPAKKSDGTTFRFPKEAYQLLNYYIFGKRKAYIFFIMSEGGKGKSTFSNFLRCVFKNETYAADTAFMNQFSVASWAGSRLVYFNDCTANYIENSHVLKQISGDDELQFEAKGVQATPGKMDAHLLFLGNEPIGYNILDSGMRRRFINIPWNADESGIKEEKWINYEWTPEEILEQIQYGVELGELPYDNLNRDTIKQVLKSKPAFHFTRREFYIYQETVPGHKYSIANFENYRQLVCQYFTKKEWETECKKLKTPEWKDFDD